MTERSRSEGSIVLPSALSRSEDVVLQYILAHVPPPVRHAARSAVHSLGLSEALVGVDENMAAFRSITAEEEAATSLFLSLKRRGYKGADRLRHRDHRFKNAVAPFLAGVRTALAKAEQLGTLVVDLRIPTAQNQVDLPTIAIWTPKVPIGKRILPEPPLGFNMSVNHDLHDFRKEFEKVAAESGIQTVEKYVRDRGNQRNRLLYAANDGIPRIEGLQEFLAAQRKRVFQILTAVVFVDPYPDQQLFVQQCLDAFLEVAFGIGPEVDKENGDATHEGDGA